MGNCSPSPRRRRPTPPGSPPLRRTASSTAAATATTATTVSPYALARSPSVSATEAEQESVVRVYGSDGCPVAWRLRVSLLYKAAAPVHFTPSEAAPLGRPVLRLSASDPEVSGAADELLRHVDARFEGKPRVALPERPAARASLAAASAEEVAEPAPEWEGTRAKGMPRGQEKFLCIVDLKGWGYANSDVRAYIATIEIMQNYYPERLGKALMIHVPYIFMKVWNMVYPFIDSHTREKFVFIDNKSLQETLHREIDESQLPDIYGGKMALVPLKDYMQPQAV